MKCLLLLSHFFFVLFLLACSSGKASEDQKLLSGDQTNSSGLNNNLGDGNKVIVLCRCGKGYVSWSGEDESSAKEVVKKNCESLSKSIRDCRVKEE